MTSALFFAPHYIRERMSVSPGCFENIIGLSRTPCECVDDAPSGADISESGLFMDEYPGMGLLLANGSVKCGEIGLWSKMARARDNAIQATKSDLMQCLAMNTDRRRASGNYEIGDQKKVQGDGPALRNTYAGMTVQVANAKGAIGLVKSIGIALKTSGTFNVDVYDREGVIGTFPVNAVANRVTWNDLPTDLSLEMFNLGGNDNRFWFVFRPADIGENIKAMASRFSCGCGGPEPRWNTESPQYYSSVVGPHGTKWMEWAMASGTYGDDIDDRDNWSVGNKLTYGMLLRVQFDCDFQTSFCSDSPNYQTDAIQRAIAQAVWYKANAILIEDILMSTNINIYTMTAGKELAALRDELLYNYAGLTKGVKDPTGEWLDGFVCRQLSEPDGVNQYGDCSKCRNKWGQRIVLIRN